MLLLGEISAWKNAGLRPGLTRRYSGEYDAANALIQAAKERTIESVGRRVGVQPFVVW